MTSLTPKLIYLLDRESMSGLSSENLTIVVAVSGGADSVALLHALHAYASVNSSKNIDLTVVHVNHNLRHESIAEASFVAQLCQSLGVPVISYDLEIGKKPGGMSPEDHWRRHRYNAFKSAMTATGAGFLALGHNLDDLAETFLYHLIRGTGIQGLSFNFFKEVDGLQIIRPLWKTRRREIEETLATINQGYITDPSNADIRYSRNRIRNEVMPILNTINPQAASAIYRASQAISEHLSRPISDTELFAEQYPSVESFTKNPDRAGARLYQYITDATGQLPNKKQISQSLSMLHGNKTGTVALGRHCTLVLTQSFLWIAPVDQPTNFDLAVSHCKQFKTIAVKMDEPVRLSNSSRILKSMSGQEIEVNSDTEVLLRNRRPGDRIGNTPLKKLMIHHQVPWYVRDYLILAEQDGRIVQILGACDTINSTITRKYGLHKPVDFKNL